MSAMGVADWVEVVVLALLAAAVVACVALGLLAWLGVFDHEGWVARERRRHWRAYTAADVALVRQRQRRTERWLDAYERNGRAPATYREVPLRDLVARANRVPGWMRAGAHPHAFLTISPDPRRKES